MRSTTIRFSLVGALGVACLSAPALAGPIYVPTVLNEEQGDFERRTEVWITNPEDVVHGFYTYFIPTLADGTVREVEASLSFIAPRASLRLSTLVDEGARGMVEFDGAPALQYSARIASYDGSGFLVGDPVELPLVSSSNLIAANKSATLQGWEKSGDEITTDVGVVNIGHALANCTASVYLKEGTAVAENVGFQLPALTAVQFDDALSLLGLDEVAKGARGVVQCDQPFFVHALVNDDVDGEVEVGRPAISSDLSSLLPPDGGGGGGGGGGGTEDGADVFRLDGLYLHCTKSNKNWKYFPNVPGKAYRRIVADFDVGMGAYDPQEANGWHMLFWEQNGPKWANMHGYLNITGNAKVIFENQLGGFDKHVTSHSFPAGSNLHVRYDWNAIAKTMNYEISGGGGHSGGLKVNVKSLTPAGWFIAHGSFDAVGPEANTYGWQFKNLVLQFIP